MSHGGCPDLRRIEDAEHAAGSTPPKPVWHGCDHVVPGQGFPDRSFVVVKYRAPRVDHGPQSAMSPVAHMGFELEVLGASRALFTSFTGDEQDSLAAEPLLIGQRPSTYIDFQRDALCRMHLPVG